MNALLHAYTLLFFLLFGCKLGKSDLCALTDGSYQKFIKNVLENTGLGSVIGRADITGNSSDVTLTQMPPSEFFSYDPISQNITLIKELDTDNGTSTYTFTIQCNSNENGARETTISVFVLVLDYNDNAPIFARDTYNCSISEDKPVGSLVFSGAVAVDKDVQYGGNSQVYYSIIPGTFSSFFKIELPTQPTITLNKSLDYETYHRMVVEILAEDRPAYGPKLNGTATVIIHILDADDLNPAFSSDQYTAIIRRDTPPGTEVRVVPAIFAADQDSLNTSIKYSIADKSNLFEIDEIFGTLKVKGTLTSRENPMLIKATQVDNPFRVDTSLLIVTVLEVNATTPRFLQTSYKAEVQESVEVGTVLLTAETGATDIPAQLQFRIINDTSIFEINNRSRIILRAALDYETQTEYNFMITVTNSVSTSTATVTILVTNVNDNNPEIQDSDISVTTERRKGAFVTQIKATDRDVASNLSFILGGHEELFVINAYGEIYLSADPSALILNTYTFQVLVRDDGRPPRESAALVTVKLPNLTEPVSKASTLQVMDTTLTIILGSVAGVLLVVVFILIAYIIWRHKYVKEQLSKARAPRGHGARGLTYRQAELPDDLPKLDLNFSADLEETSDIDGTTIQDNPLSDEKINQGYLQSSGSEMDRDVGEIDIDTAVIPYNDDYGYGPHRLNYPTGGVSSFQTDNESSGSDISSHNGSRRGLMGGAANKIEPSDRHWGSNDSLPVPGSQNLLSPDASVVPIKERPAITVYF
ncbi:hypothetical protein CHS0354_035030 [Potamilus streckersoni]|uniref:Cadherin domain-containing protein n=1 Tax=Potamilus streckersoni TaxID=2493646 RepID=A0AAE0SEK3_9BIVA|nr:hypothetical protein CHS0354_035030 [Potamilus streckersoni]